MKTILAILLTLAAALALGWSIKAQIEWRQLPREARVSRESRWSTLIGYLMLLAILGGGIGLLLDRRWAPLLALSGLALLMLRVLRQLLGDGLLYLALRFGISEGRRARLPKVAIDILRQASLPEFEEKAAGGAYQYEEDEGEESFDAEYQAYLRSYVAKKLLIAGATSVLLIALMGFLWRLS